MQKQNDLANNLKNLFNPNEYTEFKKGDFVNQPLMAGYFYIFKNITKPRFCVILNSSNDTQYPTNSVKIQDYVFIVFNIKDLEAYLQNFSTDFLPTILSKIDENIQKKDPRNLPYGYYTDVDGEIKVDLKKATEVRRIYDRYIEIESVRQIVHELNSNFSHVRDVLHANEEYMQMKEKIVPMSKLKTVNELLAQNVKGTFKKFSTEDEIKELRKKRKQQQKLSAMA